MAFLLAEVIYLWAIRGVNELMGVESRAYKVRVVRVVWIIERSIGDREVVHMVLAVLFRKLISVIVVIDKDVKTSLTGGEVDAGFFHVRSQVY